MMSEENVQRALRAMKAATAPSPDIATLEELYSPDHVLVPIGAGGIEAEGHGLDGFLAWRQETSEVLAPEFRYEEALELSASAVLVASTVRIHGASSGMELDERIWLIARFNEGKIFRTEAYSTRAQALQAVGLSE